MTIIEFLESMLDEQGNDISVTKFLNDIATGDAATQNILITEFLEYAHHGEHDYHGFLH